jgi:hypothetical protein
MKYESKRGSPFHFPQFGQFDYIISAKHTIWRVEGSAGRALAGECPARHQVVVFRGDDIHSIEDILEHLYMGILGNSSVWK